MKSLKSKLASRRGASLLLAMLVFLLCALAGTAALAAASAGAGRYTHMREDQRKYLAVASAVELLRGELTENRFRAVLETTETVTYRDWPIVENTVVSQAVPLDYGFYPLAGGGGEAASTVLGGLLEDYFVREASNLLRDTGETEGPLKAALTLRLRGLADVRVEVAADAFDVTMLMYIPEDGGRAYCTAVTVPGVSALKPGKPAAESPQEAGGKLIREIVRVDELTVAWNGASAVIAAVRPEEVLS